MKIWKCPACQAGVRAPEHLRKIDARRYCLRCTAKTGLLVERIIPAKLVIKAGRVSARAEARAARVSRRAHAEAAASIEVANLAATFDRPRERAAEWLRAWAPRIAALTSLREHHWEYHSGPGIIVKWNPHVRIRQSGLRKIKDTLGQVVMAQPTRRRASGHAWPWAHRLCVTTGDTAADDLSTLIHEFAHLAAPHKEMHGPTFQMIQRDAVRELTGEDIEGWRRSGEEGRVAIIQRWLDSQKQKETP